MLVLLKIMLAGFMCDYVALSFCRIAEKISFVEKYKNRKIFASYVKTIYGPKAIYTVDKPFIFIASSDWKAIKASSVEEARYKIDSDIRNAFVSKLMKPMKKMRIMR